MEGTIARGYSSIHYADDPAVRLAAMSQFTGEATATSIAYKPNSAAPYYYKDTEEERARAMAEIVDNPLPITIGRP